MRTEINMCEIATKSTLLELGMSRFPDISTAEKKLLNATADAKGAIYGESPTEDRVVRGEVLSWICTCVDAAAKVTHRGISIDGAEVTGKVELEWGRVLFPIQATNCVFRDAINLKRAQINYLALSGTSIDQLSANGAVFEGSVLLNDGFRAQSEVNLAGAKLAGDLACDDGLFIGGEEALALDVRGATIEGGVHFRNGFKALCGVNVVGTVIGGNLDCESGQFASDGRIPALDAT
jgi:hypothetical protein